MNHLMLIRQYHTLCKYLDMPTSFVTSTLGNDYHSGIYVSSAVFQTKILAWVRCGLTITVATLSHSKFLKLNSLHAHTRNIVYSIQDPSQPITYC
jgi:hypothetical protein